MRVAALLAAAFLLAGCAGGGKTTTTTVTLTRTVTTETNPKPGPLSQTSHLQYFGVPVSITQVDAKRYLLVLKPEYFLVGVTANVVGADQQGTQCAPLNCPGVDNDHVVIPVGQDLTFILPADAKGTVITLGQGVLNTPVTATQLAAIVGGAPGPNGMEPLESGVWLTVDVDTVTSFAQQYQP